MQGGGCWCCPFYLINTPPVIYRDRASPWPNGFEKAVELVSCRPEDSASLFCLCVCVCVCALFLLYNLFEHQMDFDACMHPTSPSIHPTNLQYMGGGGRGIARRSRSSLASITSVPKPFPRLPPLPLRVSLFAFPPRHPHFSPPRYHPCVFPGGWCLAVACLNERACNPGMRAL